MLRVGLSVACCVNIVSLAVHLHGRRVSALGLKLIFTTERLDLRQHGLGVLRILPLGLLQRLDDLALQLSLGTGGVTSGRSYIAVHILAASDTLAGDALCGLMAKRASDHRCLLVIDLLLDLLDPWQLHRVILAGIDRQVILCSLHGGRTYHICIIERDVWQIAVWYCLLRCHRGLSLAYGRT